MGSLREQLNCLMEEEEKAFYYFPQSRTFEEEKSFIDSLSQSDLKARSRCAQFDFPSIMRGRKINIHQTVSHHCLKGMEQKRANNIYEVCVSSVVGIRLIKGSGKKSGEKKLLIWRKKLYKPQNQGEKTWRGEKNPLCEKRGKESVISPLNWRRNLFLFAALWLVLKRGWLVVVGTNERGIRLCHLRFCHTPISFALKSRIFHSSLSPFWKREAPITQAWIEFPGN